MPTTPATDDTTKDTTAGDSVATEAIFINGVRAYNAGDRVSANAVKNNKLQKLVDKA